MRSFVALLELEGKFADNLDADGEGVGALDVDGDGIVVAIAETTAETALGCDSLLAPKQGYVGQRGDEQQQREPPTYGIEWGVGIADASNEGDGKQQEVEAAAQKHLEIEKMRN